MAYKRRIAARKKTMTLMIACRNSTAAINSIAVRRMQKKSRTMLAKMLRREKRKVPKNYLWRQRSKYTLRLAIILKRHCCRVQGLLLQHQSKNSHNPKLLWRSCVVIAPN